MTKKNNQLPPDWARVPFRELLIALESGKRPRGGVKNIKSGVPSIGGEHLNANGGFKFEKIKYVPKEFASGMVRGHIQKNDILIVKDGATTGKTSLVMNSFPHKKAVVNEHVFLCRSAKGVDPLYLFYFLFSLEGNQQILKDFRGAAQGGISQGFADIVKVPLAPQKEQERISCEIEKQFSRLDEAVDNLKRVKANLKRYKASVLKAAVEGKLTEEWRKKNLPALSSKPGKFYTYAILCDNDSIYIGHTNDIERRWKQHLEGKGAEWTTKHKPVKIVHWEKFDTRKEAAEREKWLKTGYGRKWIKREYAAGKTRQAGHVEQTDKLLERILVERRKKWEEAELARLRERAVRRQAKMEARGKKPKDDKWKKKYKESAKPNLNDFSELQDGWLWVNIDQIMLLLTDYHANGSYKVLKKHVTILDEDAYAIYVRATNLKKNTFDSDLKFVNKKAYDFLTKSKIFGNEIIIGKIGNAGKVYCMPKLDQPCTLGMNLFMLRFNQFLSGKYIYYHLVSFFSEKEIKSKVKGVGNPSIDKNAIRSLRIALPPIREQDQIVKVVDEQMSLIAHFENELERHLLRADHLRQSILKKAFSGKLVPQDANNESAVTLLKKTG